MEKFTHIAAAACPLPAENIDTDQILPARYLKLPRNGEHGKVLFHDLRFDAAGAERADFPLNRAHWRQAKVIVAGRNFGGGSSREAAVYALFDYGIRCVIAPSFGDIFSQNASKNGLLTAVLGDAETAARHLGTAARSGFDRRGRSRVAIDLLRRSEILLCHRSVAPRPPAQRVGRFRRHSLGSQGDRRLQGRRSQAATLGDPFQTRHLALALTNDH